MKHFRLLDFLQREVGAGVLMPSGHIVIDTDTGALAGFNFCDVTEFKRAINTHLHISCIDWIS